MTTMDVTAAMAEAAADREYCRDQINARLKEKNWNQARLCKETGISKQSMSQYLSAAAMPGDAALRKIARAFNCWPNVFIRPEEKSFCEVRESSEPNFKIFACRVLLPAAMAFEMAKQIAEHQQHNPPPPVPVEAVAAAVEEKRRPKRPSAKP